MLLFSHSVGSNSLWPHGLQHIRLPCPSLFPGAYSNSSIESVTPSNHLILCGPLLLLPPIFPSIRVFSSETALRIRWSKYWSFSFSISPSNENSGLISFRMDPKTSQTQSPDGCGHLSGSLSRFLMDSWGAPGAAIAGTQKPGLPAWSSACLGCWAGRSSTHVSLP